MLDELAERGVVFPRIAGVSAGAGCMVNFVSDQPGRSMRVLLPPRGARWSGPEALLHSGRLLDLGRMLEGAEAGDNPFDFTAYFASPAAPEFVATCCETGEAAYLTDGGDRTRLLRLLRASCSVPGLCDPVEIDGRHYLDGSVADPIPAAHLLVAGCDRVLAVLTRPAADAPSDYARLRLTMSRLYQEKHPALFTALMDRAARYERTRQTLEREAAAGRIFLLRPTLPPPHALTHAAGHVRRYYEHGRALTREKWGSLSAFLANASPRAGQVTRQAEERTDT